MKTVSQKLGRNKVQRMGETMKEMMSWDLKRKGWFLTSSHLSKVHTETDGAGGGGGKHGSHRLSRPREAI